MELCARHAADDDRAVPRGRGHEVAGHRFALFARHADVARVVVFHVDAPRPSLVGVGHAGGIDFLERGTGGDGRPRRVPEFSVEVVVEAGHDFGDARREPQRAALDVRRTQHLQRQGDVERAVPRLDERLCGDGGLGGASGHRDVPVRREIRQVDRRRGPVPERRIRQRERAAVLWNRAVGVDDHAAGRAGVARHARERQAALEVVGGAVQLEPAALSPREAARPRHVAAQLDLMVAGAGERDGAVQPHGPGEDGAVVGPLQIERV